MSTLWHRIAPKRDGGLRPIAPTTTRRILCVDDDPLIAASLTRMLYAYGVEVLTAYSGPHGYWRVMVEHPDLVITDIGMPNGDGAELIYCMRSNSETAAIPVIVVTGIHDPTLRQRLAGTGIASYLQKPVTWPTLLAEIQRHLPLMTDIRHGASDRDTWQ